MDSTDANLLTLEPSQFNLDATYDFLSKTVPSLSDVEIFIDDYTLDTPHATIPVTYFNPELWSPTGPPNRNCFNGPYDFKVEVNSSDVNKKKYLYSHRLHRIYVDMETPFSLHFDWRAPTAAPHTMLVRATVVFTDDAQAEKRVERCDQHYYQNAKLQVSEDQKVVLKNVLHSSRELGSAGVEYCGSVAADDAWFSVLVELTKTSEHSVAHAYKFVCKNSCPNGINRRPISILFTLEDKDHRVYGRQMVGARVCACPRRDMYKDEKSEGVRGKRTAPRPPTPHRLGKKVKTEALSETGSDVIVLPSIQVKGARAAVAGLEVMRYMMQEALERGSAGDPAATATAEYSGCIAHLTTVIDQVKAKGNL